MTPQLFRSTGRLLASVAGSALLLGGAAACLVPSGAALGSTTGASTTTSTSTSTSIPTTWSLAKVHLRVTSTSDWAQVAIGGGYPLARRGATSGGARGTATSDGVDLSGAGSYDADVVLGVTTSDIRFQLDKGYAGTLTVDVFAPGATTPLFETTDVLHQTSGQHPNRSYGVLPRADVTPAVVAPASTPRGDSRRLTLAFAYPWFGHDYSDRRMAERPQEPRSWFEADGVLSMTRQAKEHGIDGFVLSYAGESANGASLDRALAAADLTGSVVSPYLEVSNIMAAAPPLSDKPAVVEAALRSALDRAGDPAFLRLRGTPVVFVYAMGKLNPGQWAAIRSHLAAAGRSVLLVGDDSDAAYRPLVAGLHSYTAVADVPTLAARSQYASAVLRAGAVLDGAATPLLDVATVSPGYDDRKMRGFTNPVVPRDGGRRYDDTWAAALSGYPDWVVVTSWNEWYEGTAVEPGTVSGGLALTQTAQHAAAWKSAS